MSMKAFSGTAI